MKRYDEHEAAITFEAVRSDVGTVTQADLIAAFERDTLGPIEHDGRYRFSAGFNNCTHERPHWCSYCYVAPETDGP